MEITLAQLAAEIGGIFQGQNADSMVTGVSGYDSVEEGEVTYLISERNLPEAEASPALAIIAPRSLAQSSKPLILVDNPRAAFARALQLFDWRRPFMAGIDPLAYVANTASIHPGAYVGPFAAIGQGAVIGDGCQIYPHAVVGDLVEIGDGSVLYPNVTIYARCRIGRNVHIHSGAVIGADGHGYNPGPQGWERIPHIGTVIIEDEVEIGANTTIDRATTGQTVIGHGTKIDNLVMIAHNCKIGARCMIIAFVGISGSTVIEDDVIIAGQVGIVSHRHVGAGARLTARAGISRDVPPGSTVSGNPAQNHFDQLRLDAAIHRAPEMLERIKTLEKRLAELEKHEAEGKI